MNKKRIQDMTNEEKWEAIDEMVEDDKASEYATEHDPAEDYTSSIDYSNYTEL